MKHYICTEGCKGISQKPCLCQAKTCSKHNKQLVECDCKDGKHGGAF